MWLNRQAQEGEEVWVPPKHRPATTMTRMQEQELLTQKSLGQLPSRKLTPQEVEQLRSQPAELVKAVNTIIVRCEELTGTSAALLELPTGVLEELVFVNSMNAEMFDNVDTWLDQLKGFIGYWHWGET